MNNMVKKKIGEMMSKGMKISGLEALNRQYKSDIDTM